MLEQNIDSRFTSNDLDTKMFESYRKSINDDKYFDFMRGLNGGFSL